MFKRSLKSEYRLLKSPCIFCIRFRNFIMSFFTKFCKSFFEVAIFSISLSLLTFGDVLPWIFQNDTVEEHCKDSSRFRMFTSVGRKSYPTWMLSWPTVIIFFNSSHVPYGCSFNGFLTFEIRHSAGSLWFCKVSLYGFSSLNIVCFPNNWVFPPDKHCDFHALFQQLPRFDHQNELSVL